MKVFLTIAFSLFIVLHITAQTPEFWGVTKSGGAHDAGAIFKTDINAVNYSVEHSFVKTEGARPIGNTLCDISNGKYIGLTSIGGVNNGGVIYEFDTLTNTITKKFDFEQSTSGYSPRGAMILASNGKLYGMTAHGGSFGGGTIIEYDPVTNSVVKKIDFDGVSKGSQPEGSLVQAVNGKLYGMTYSGGVNGDGVLFEYTISTNTFVKKIDFDNIQKGASPMGSLIQGSNGKFYGLTKYGGPSNRGVVFEYDMATGIFIRVVNFDGVGSGSYPLGSLLKASNGKLYGLTSYGGVNNDGVLFEYNMATGAYLKKLDFNSTITGKIPMGTLMQATSGKFYGSTQRGGANNDGVLFEYDLATSTYAVKVSFDSDSTGIWPTGGAMVQSSQGKLYGTIQYGGKGYDGVIFEYNITPSTYTDLVNFDYAPIGSHPSGGLLELSNGSFYGLTQFGGTTDDGVLFEYNPVTNLHTAKINFLAASNGAEPCGTLLNAINGKYYGLCFTGGTYQYGSIFEYNDITNAIAQKVAFDGTPKGARPLGSLVQAGNGKIYGMTSKGGTTANPVGYGVVFEYDPATNVYSKKVTFDGPLKGKYPEGSLLVASNGKLYGLTSMGGTTNDGVLFEYNTTTSTFTKLVEFNGLGTGEKPKGSLIEASNGKLYGVTSEGGLNGDGVLFEYDIAINSLTNKIDFNDTLKGKMPKGTLLQSINGNLYGTTSEGGLFGKGVLFEYNPSTSSFVKKTDFDGTNGSTPVYNLIEAVGCDSTTFSYSTNACNSFTVPSGDSTYTTIGTYTILDTIPNSCGADSLLTIQLTITGLTTGVDYQTSCDSLTWIDGTTYYTSNNTAKDTLINALGCDSIITLDLTIYNSSNSIDTVLSCGSYTWINGITYTTNNNTAVDTLINTNGCDSIVTLNLTISNLNANYTYVDNGSGSYSFTNSSTGNYTNTHWAFGDGTTSTSINSTHTYQANGSYVIVLAIYNSNVVGDSCISYFFDTINVTGVTNPTQCNAGWTVLADSTTGGVTIVNSSTGTNLTYHWEFGDGDTSNLQFPSHTYSTNGPYNLCLTINDTSGCSDTYCDSISSNGVLFKNGFDLNVVANYPLGIQNLGQKPEVKIYPNPTSSTLNIETQNFKITKILIRDNSGKVIKTITSNFDVVNVESLATGVYHVELIGEKEMVSKKFIKQ